MPTSVTFSAGVGVQVVVDCGLQRRLAGDAHILSQGGVLLGRYRGDARLDAEAGSAFLLLV